MPGCSLRLIDFGSRYQLTPSRSKTTGSVGSVGSGSEGSGIGSAHLGVQARPRRSPILTLVLRC